MSLKITHEKIRITGMYCINCKRRIDKCLKSVPGVISASSDYKSGLLDISYNPAVISRSGIEKIIHDLGYGTAAGDNNVNEVLRAAVLAGAVFLLYLAADVSGILNLLVPTELADSSMGYWMLFVTGLVTSVHCIAMCGGINLSQSLPSYSVASSGEPASGAGKTAEADKKTSKNAPGIFKSPALFYNLGRVISYTIIGGILGLCGMIASGIIGIGFTSSLSGIIKIIAGILMALLGLNMLGIAPVLKAISPGLPDSITSKLAGGAARIRGAFAVGLINGLMPCGPLQSMQLVALSSQNPVTGMLSMFFFSLGTLPLMLGFGTIVSILGRRFTRAVLNAGAVLITVMGFSMLSQGAALSGLISGASLSVLIAAFLLILILSNISAAGKLIKTPAAACVCAVFVVLCCVFYSKSSTFSTKGSDSSGSAINEAAAVSADKEPEATSKGSSSSRPSEKTNPFGNLNTDNNENDASEEISDTDSSYTDTENDKGETDESANEAAEPEAVQVVESTLSSRRYPDIEVKAGTEVEWVIHADKSSINGCNYVMVVPEYELAHQFEEGDNIITFMPEEPGTYSYSCWMGMIRGTITVV